VIIAQLRDIIVSLLSASPDLIGTYVLPDGNRIPSVYVVGRQSVPKEWRAEGLEVTMREFPERLPKAGVGIVDVLQQWEVVMVQYATSGRTLPDAMDRMTRRFPDATFRYLPGDDIAYERCRIIIPDRQVKTLIR
jgi:hypothetical protein